MIADLPPPEMPVPGWYRDPEMAGTQRYWNGASWTEHRAPIASSTASDGDSVLAIVGWLGAIFFPLLGLIIGIVLISRGDGDAGWPIVIATLIFSAAFTALVLIT